MNRLGFVIFLIAIIGIGMVGTLTNSQMLQAQDRCPSGEHPRGGACVPDCPGPLCAISPGVGPINPGVGPINPGVGPINPGVGPINPGVGPINPGVGPINPGNHGHPGLGS
jgi:hypothetical protein